MNKHATPDLAFDIESGHPNRLGADYDGEGTNFALFSDNATAVELCLFDETGKEETHRLEMPAMEGGIWHGYLPGIRPGQAYGYRVHGAFAPEEGHRFNPAKLLLDPYARELRGQLQWDDSLFGYPMGEEDTVKDERDSAAFMPKAVVVDPAFDWEADKALRHRWEDTVIYEAHVRGMTMRHQDVPEADRGTFKGLASKPIINHLKSIGVTAIELLPVHGFLNDQHLADKGLSNYWGYNTLCFFAPHRQYLKSGAMREVKEAIKRFHDAGIEVILDVVYNHTAEGNEKGPTLSFRGIDNASYYLLSPEEPRHSFDTTGTGNTLNMAHPMVLRMVLDSLRYWVEVMHVDGFRFDLASTLGREPHGFEREGAFFGAIRQDPVLSTVKLIAEPWDIGDGGYQVGGFPWPFREWNDKARDDLRAFWRRDPGLLSETSQRLLGSPVQFSHSRRPATSSVNFLAAHDGFTLWDTVSYNEKHNDANGEGGADGHDHNLSHNLGAEGPTEDEGILNARLRRVKGMLATLFLSQGVPMILAGDEFGQTQGGNNNVYCQDNEIAWLDWDAAKPELMRAVADLVAFRKADGGLSRPRFATGPDAPHEATPIATWHHPAGREMESADWEDQGLGLFAMRMQLPEARDMLVVFNTGDDGAFALPEGNWTRKIDTSRDVIACDEPAEGEVPAGWQSVQVFVAG
ncbi:glycogen debranching enzyme GlgX [Cereibacter changlensis JA139]|uniref:Glycogen debranching enzyme GlgX n=2 Tax=Cereibacter changlensis TaxID=402884 RepID=A0A2T4JSA7_9RHOB|nr:glycogen debranching protein GlgX [Cereibacter changlensis]PTE20801.1 glycogen debranching enzyme GlgX [Cereibacter changlensis JA139]PZX53679.1 glycogen operon protein [Cereibacter changlensis]